MWRNVYSYAIDPEIYLDANNLRSLVAQTLNCSVSSLEGRSIAASPVSLVERVSALRDRAQKHEKTWDAVFSSQRSDETLILQSTPMASAAGAALQGLSAPSVFEDSHHLKLMALLADDIGVGAVEKWRFDHFRQIARSYGLTQAAGTLRELPNQRTIRDGMFHLPGLIYALSRRSDAFDCELIGIDLAWRTLGLLPPWRALTKVSSDPRWRHLDLSVAQTNALPTGAKPIELAEEIARSLAKTSIFHHRLSLGVAFFAELMEAWNNLLLALFKATRDPRLAMAILVQDRSREAKIYHDDFKLEGRPLSRWFADAQEDPIPFVDALARSRLVRTDKPERSPLINGLICDGGPMFRIFSDADVAIIRQWIESLAEQSIDRSGSNETVLPKPICLRHPYQEVKGGDLEIGEWPRNIRTAYYLLQGRALTPQTRAFAHAYCTFWLTHAGRSVDNTNRSLPTSWRPGLVREWLLTSHDAHSEEFKASRNAPLPSREDVISQTLQLAPLTLIDGAWLQGFTEVSLASSRVGAPLFETYWDELGNSEWRINHPKIYRDVLAAMDIVLPPTGSCAFAEDRRLCEASFRLPVYWLSIGKFPVTFRPEILGLNLAMELSGVGGSYRSARTFLKHYNFPTTFVDIHNTIDNVSTGHSAWAADAIDAYVQMTHEIVPVCQTWSRIRVGYASLAPTVNDPKALEFFESEGANAISLDQHNPLNHQSLLAVKH